MSMWGSEDVRNVYAGLNSKGQGDRAGWLKPVGTAVGAAGGFLVGGPAGAMAGAQMGGAAGGLGHDVANGQVTPQGVLGDVASGVSGFQGIDKAAQAKALIEAFMANPHQFRTGFALGGVVPPAGSMDQLLRLLQNGAGSPNGHGLPSGPSQAPQGLPGASSGVLGAIPGQVTSMIGSGPDLPKVQDLQTARHPGWEATASVLAKLLESLPQPANRKNTKAIGAWAPALGVLAGAPGEIAAGRRKSANTTIEAGNLTRQQQYEADKKAYEAQRGTLMNTLAGNATKPTAPGSVKNRVPIMQSDWTYMLRHKAIPKPVLEEYTANDGTLSAEGYQSFQAAVDNLRQSENSARSAGAAAGTKPADTGFELSPEALRQQAVHFAVTGTFALTGRNKEIVKEQVRVANEVARMFPKRQIALARAAYNGDKASMAKIVQGRDGIEAFANSAERNLGMMKDVLSQIPEAGAEVFNTPVRQFESQFRGNPAMSAFHALRMSLNAEYSRLTQSAQVSGVGIPVSAQKEIERAIAPGATVGQILSAYQVLYEESSNRADAMNAMVEEIGRRMELEPPADTRPPMSGGIKKGN